MDDNTGFLINSFQNKSDLAKVGTTLIKRLKTENKKMEELSINQDLGVRFEYTSVGTPQQNGRVERKIATLYGRVGSGQ